MYDMAIIGGGINGCAIARDAAGRGYSVFLAEKGDLASGTSSGATKLIHGGLRYLEHYEFRLVRESLTERETLWSIAPHIIWPMRFVLPHHSDLRPAWLLRLGLFLYDHIGGRERLPGTRTLDLKQDVTGTPLRAGFSRGFEYSDCWVDDARFVALTARDAANKGADIRTRTEITDAARAENHWSLTAKDMRSGAEEKIQARIVVNAAGPWIDRVLSGVFRANDATNIRLVQGSHIVIRRRFGHDRAYIFQNADGRILFAIPYENDFTLIGTTDHDQDVDPDTATITEKETQYLCAAISEYLREPVTPDDVIWSYAAVRPLYDDGESDAKTVTRDYVLSLDAKGNGSALLNIFGGKLTTCRCLAEDVIEKLAEHLPSVETRRSGWTGHEPLPGGDFPVDGVGNLIANLQTDYPFLSLQTVQRFTRAYGTNAPDVLRDAGNVDDLGFHFGADLYQREVVYLVRNEWAQTAEDIVWRRTKLGLRMTADEIATLDAWLTENLMAHVA